MGLAGIVFIHLEVFKGAVVNITRGVIVVFVSVDMGESFLLFMLGLVGPVKHRIGGRLVGCHPRHNHCSALLISLCYMNLESPIAKPNRN